MPKTHSESEDFRVKHIPGFLIRRIQQILTAMVYEETAGHDVTPVQVALMMTVQEFPGRDQRSIASILKIDQVTIGSVAIRLEQRGILTRRTLANDRRSKVLRLTEEGRKLLASTEPGVRAAQEKFFGCLGTEEREAFVKTLHKLVQLNDDHALVPQDLPPASTRNTMRGR